MIDVAVMGYGVVGSGVVKILTERAEELSKKAKEKINLKYILDIREFKDSPLADKFTNDFNKILNDESVKVVAELIGGLMPAYEYVEKCLRAGKNVVTSNKELVAKKGAALIKIAQENNVNFLFEASVGGGIPIIRPMTQCLVANRIEDIVGILNGTTNFILTKMVEEELEFDEALKMAQELGYAERDPSADIDGDDACRKICILASLAWGKHIYPEDVHTKGIRDVTKKDIENASSLGCVLKLVARAKRNPQDDKIEIFVEPMMFNKKHILANVNDVYNAVIIKGDATDRILLYGKGAGKMPTASAVVADIVDCIKHLDARKYVYWEDKEDGLVKDNDECKSEFYIRLSWGKEDTTTVSIEEVLQCKCKCNYININHNHIDECGDGSWYTRYMSVKDMKKAVRTLENGGYKVDFWCRARLFYEL